MISNNVFKKIASTISDKTGVSFIQSGDNWKADVEKKVIYYPSKYLSEADLGLLVHEAGHIRFTDVVTEFDNEIKEKLNGRVSDKILKETVEKIFELLKTLEDLRINSKMIDIYKGSFIYIKHNYYKLFNQWKGFLEDSILFNTEKYNEAWGDDLCKQYLILLLSYQFVDEKDFSYFLESFVNKRVQIAFNNTFHYSSKVEKAKTTLEVFDILKEYFLDEYLKLIDDEDDDDNDDSEESNDKNESDENEEKNNDDGDKDKKKNDDDKKSSNDDEKSDDSDSDSSDDDNESGEDENNENNENNEDNEDNESEEENEKSKSDFSDCNNSFLPPEDERTAVGGSGGDYSEIKFDEVDFRYKKKDDWLQYEILLDFVDKNISKARGAISVLKDLEFERHESGFRSGNIDKRKIVKIPTGNERVFERKVALANDNKDMAVAILVDESGSMHAEKKYDKEKDKEELKKDVGYLRRSRFATKSVSLLAKALYLSKKNFAVYGFNRKFFIHKDWNKKFKLVDMLDIDHNTRRDGRGDNNDGYAIWKTTQILKKRPEKNKILIVFSDGQPAESYGVDEETGKYYRSFVLEKEAIEAEKIAKVYSFGVCSDAVERYYKRSEVFFDLDKLPEALIKMFKSNAGKRIR